MIMKLPSLCSFFLLIAASVTNGQECEEVGTLLNCGYNETFYGSPNNTANSDRINSVQSATFFLPQLTEVIKSECSSQTLRFGCAALFPSCGEGLGPCRSLCHRVTTDCGTIFVEQLQLESVVLAPLLQCNK